MTRGCVSKLTTTGPSPAEPSRWLTASRLTCQCEAADRPCVFSATTLSRHFGHNVSRMCVGRVKSVPFSTHRRSGRHFEYVSLVTLRKLLDEFHTHGSHLVTVGLGKARNSELFSGTCGSFLSFK